MIFNKESDFEEALIKILSEKGWEKEVLKNYSEQDLLQNWANILFENNRDIDRLNDYPLTDGEMQQILEQIKNLRTPLKLNGFINGKSVSVIRDNPDDKLHFGKEVSLKIYTGLIDADYMNSRFEKYLKLLNLEGASAEAVGQAETELHKTFATLSQEEQKYANIFLHDIQRGDVAITEGKTLRDYITEYLSKAKDDQIHRVAVALGVDELKLRTIMSLRLNSTNINEFGRYDDLKKTVNKAKAKEYFEKIEGTKIIPPKVNVKVDNLLREFILGGGFEIEMPE